MGVELSRLSGYVAASVELRKCLIHMLQLRSNRVAIIGYGVPVSRFPSEERRDFSIGGIVFNLSRRRGAHPRVPRKVFHRKFLRRSIPISSLFLASFHLISSYREEQLCRFLCEIHLTHRIDRCDIHYAYLFVGEVKCAK